MKTASNVPIPTLKRLPKYLNYLKQLQLEGEVDISASKISEALDIQHTQVRKDLAFTGAEGIPKVGHKIASLIHSIESFLNWDNVSDAFLVGLGHLGSALIGYNGFQKSGIKIVAAFDNEIKKVGSRLNDIEVFQISKLPELANRMRVNVGIITTPAESAQKVADIMVSNGIRAIWNFAPIKLNLPAHIIVENVDMYSSLALLSHKLKEKMSIKKQL